MRQPSRKSKKSKKSPKVTRANLDKVLKKDHELVKKENAEKKRMNRSERKYY